MIRLFILNRELKFIKHRRGIALPLVILKNDRDEAFRVSIKRNNTQIANPAEKWNAVHI